MRFEKQKRYILSQKKEEIFRIVEKEANIIEKIT